MFSTVLHTLHVELLASQTGHRIHYDQLDMLLDNNLLQSSQPKRTSLANTIAIHERLLELSTRLQPNYVHFSGQIHKSLSVAFELTRKPSLRHLNHSEASISHTTQTTNQRFSREKTGLTFRH